MTHDTHKFNIDVKVETAINGDDLRIVTSVGDYVTYKVLHMEDEALRAALIKLGWTPPNGGKKADSKSATVSRYDGGWFCLECFSHKEGVHSVTCQYWGREP